MTVIEFSIPTALALTSNQRLHWAQKGKRTAAIRALAKLEARRTYTLMSHELPNEMHVLNTPIDKVRVACEFGFESNRRRDAANWYPTAKAAIDGIVDAQIGLEDDDDSRIGSVSMSTYERTEKGRLWLRFTILDGHVVGGIRSIET